MIRVLILTYSNLLSHAVKILQMALYTAQLLSLFAIQLILRDVSEAASPDSTYMGVPTTL